jgi:hypothetical protein
VSGVGAGQEAEAKEFVAVALDGELARRVSSVFVRACWDRCNAGLARPESPSTRRRKGFADSSP